MFRGYRRSRDEYEGGYGHHGKVFSGPLIADYVSQRGTSTHEVKVQAVLPPLLTDGTEDLLREGEVTSVEDEEDQEEGEEVVGRLVDEVVQAAAAVAAFRVAEAEERSLTWENCPRSLPW